jgi:hypothetical protein
MKFMTTWSESTYLDELVIGILFILLPFLMRHIVKVILRYALDLLVLLAFL